MVQPTHFRERHHAAFRRPLNPSGRGRVFLEGEMASRPMIVGEIGLKGAETRFMPRHDGSYGRWSLGIRRIGVSAYHPEASLISLCDFGLRWVLTLATLRVRSDDFKELEIVVLRHELAILR
jgi:hypothetical protein